MKKIYTKLSLLLLVGAFVLLTGSVFAQNITIASGATVTIGSGAAVTGSTLINDGVLKIESDVNGTGSLIVTSASGSGVDTVQRYIPSINWHIISCPVGGQDKSTFGGLAVNDIEAKGSLYAIGTYSTANDDWDYWIQGTAGDFSVGEGHSIKRATTAGVVTFAGTSIYTGNHIQPVTNNSGYKWNAIGNPYTSAIWVKNNALEDDFLSRNNGKLESSFVGLYIWDQALTGGADYTVITKETYTFPDGEGGYLDKLNQDKIAIGQGFIIKAAATNVNFDTLMQVHASDALGGDAEFKSAEIPTPAVRLSVTSGDLVNRTVVSFDRESTRGLDPGYDVGKLKGNPNIALFTQLVDGSSDVDFMYQSVPDVDYELLTIPVGLDLKNGNDITFTLETSEGFPSDMKVYLEDKALNVTTQLDRKDTQYSVSVPSLKSYGRFNLHFTNSTTTIDDKLSVQPEFNVFTRDRLIFLNGPADKDTRFSVYGIDGKMWYQNRAEVTNQNTIDAAGFAAGVYLIKIDKQSGSQTVKVILTN